MSKADATVNAAQSEVPVRVSSFTLRAEAPVFVPEASRALSANLVAGASNGTAAPTANVFASLGETAEAAAREACQYDDPTNAYSPLVTDTDTDFGDTDTEDSIDDTTTVPPHLHPPTPHDPSPCAPPHFAPHHSLHTLMR